MEHKARTKALSWLLSLAMVLSLLPGMSLTAYAAGTELTTTTATWENGDYVVPADGVTIANHITVNGTVNLTLTEGTTLTANAGITLSDGATLNVSGEGAMVVNGSNNNASSTVAGSGALVLNGGTLTAKGGNGQSFGDGQGSKTGAAGGVAINGAVTVAGGTLNATGGNGGSLGIACNKSKGGAGGIAINGALSINGGKAIATGGNGGSIGKACGMNCEGGAGGIAINGALSINGGSMTASKGNNGSMGAGSSASVVGVGGDGYDGTLTLGVGVKLYEGTDNTGTVLDGNDSVSRVYEGEKKANMFAGGPKHEHNFTSYTVSEAGDTITATCTPTDGEDVCTLENNTATLTIAPSSTGGNTAELTGDTDEFDLTGVAITYQKKGSGGWEDSAAPGNDDTGFYRASATIVENKTISVEYGVSVITKGTGDGNGCSFEVPKIAGVGAKIKPTLTLATGYEVKKITVKDESKNDVSTAVSADTEGFTMPDYNITVDVEFGMIDYAITKNTMAYGSVTVKNSEEQEITTAHYGDTITLDVAPETGFAIKTVKYNNTPITPNNGVYSFTMPASNVTVSAEFEGEPFGITTEVSPANGGTVAISGTGVVTANNVTTAKAGSEVALTVTPAMGFQVDTVKYNNTTITASEGVYKFTMPTEAVTVSATFVGKDTTATLAVTGNEGTTCTAKLLDANYKGIDSVTKKGGEQFILLVNRDEGYGFTVTYGSNSPVLLEEFTEEEYTAYVNYANENNLPVSSDMVLARVTMPGVTEDSVTLTVNFSKLKTFTILYQPSDTGTTAVWCKFAKSGSTTAGASRMHNDAEMGDGNKVFSLKVTAADNPDQLAFVTDESNLVGANMDNATVSQNTNTWNNITGGSYLVIGGDAKTVVAAFVTDENAIPFYNNSDRGKKPEHPGAGVTYRIAVVANGNPGTVTAPTAPEPSEKGTVFAGWSALVGTAPNKAEIKCAAGATVQITENTSFSATWEPKQLTVTFNSDGGTGGSDKVTVNYKEKLPDDLEAPTKYGFALDGWTVDKSIVQDGNLFFRGSTFDLDTGITSNMGLTAEWEHVHTYTCYRLEEVGLNWFYDDNAVHIAFCSCYDYKIMAHEYGSDGMCACGKHKPEAGKVQLDVSYVQLIGGKYETKFKDKTRMEPQGKYVTLSASNLWGSDWSFAKWQYSTDKGNTWKDLAVTTSVKFGVMCDMQVRAVYEENANMKPQVELNASKCDDHFESNGTSYPMDNIAFQMSYKLPANYTFVDGGLRFGDNDGIGYYDIKERTVELSAGQNAANWIGGFATSLLTFSTPEWTDSSYTERYYELRKNNALDEMSATELAKYIYEGKTTKAKVDPIYWDSRVKTEGNRGAISTRALLNMTNAEEGNNWIYCIAWMRYKDSSGKIQTIYTDALATTLNGIVQGSKSVTKTAAN